MTVQKMYTLYPGRWASVAYVLPGALHDRLLQLGFQPGARVCRTYTDRHAFLSVYRVENTQIALRRPDAAQVLVSV